MQAEPLKLMANDADDLAVIAACVQDALVPIGDMAFLPDEHRFVLAVNRFRWDMLPAGNDRARTTADEPLRSRDARFLSSGGSVFERVHSGLRFEAVSRVQTTKIDLRHREQILELLTLHAEANKVFLVFAGGGGICLEIDRLQCFLEDFGEGWPTCRRPSHPIADGES